MTSTRRLTVLLALLLTAGVARGMNTESLLAQALPPAASARLESLGDGIGIVFSPDLSVPGNCRFYQAMGFACFDSPDWLEILSDIHAHNISKPERRIRTLILETHGTNGHGLKVQKSGKPGDPRSYISVAALQEWVQPVGIQHVIISACNSGRLLRPEIYRKLNRSPGDPLFLPATRGIIDASDSFDARKNKVTVITPASSHIETTLVGALRELAPATRKELVRAAKGAGVTLPTQFAISEMLIRMLIRDDTLVLHTGAWSDELSKKQSSPQASERLFSSFVSHLNYVASNDTKPHTAIATAGR